MFELRKVAFIRSKCHLKKKNELKIIPPTKKKPNQSLTKTKIKISTSMAEEKIHEVNQGKNSEM